MANVGDLFVNLKVRTDGLKTGSEAISSFVSGSKRDLAAMDGAAIALAQTLSKIGIDPTFVLQLRDIASIGTKALPKVAEGFAAVQRQVAKLASTRVEIPKINAIEQLAKLRAEVASAGADLKTAEASYKAMASGAAVAVAADRRVVAAKEAVQEATEKSVAFEDAVTDAKSYEQAIVLGERFTKSKDKIAEAEKRLADAQAKAAASFDKSIAADAAKVAAARERLAVATRVLTDEEQRQAAASAAAQGIGAIGTATERVADTVTAKGGAITAALRSISAFAQTIPARIDAMADSLSNGFTILSNGFTRVAAQSKVAIASLGASIRDLPSTSKVAIASLVASIRDLPSTISSGFGSLKERLSSLPATGKSAFESIKNGAMSFDATLTAVASRALVAGRTIGASIYAALGPIGLLIAAIGAAYAVYSYFKDSAQEEYDKVLARIDQDSQRAQAAFEKTLEGIKAVQSQIKAAQEVGRNQSLDISGLQDLLDATDEQYESVKRQIAVEKELRDEITKNKDAQVALAEAVERREKADKAVRVARDEVRALSNKGEIDTAEGDAATARLRQAEAQLSAQRALEAESQKLVDATAQLVNREAERLDLAEKVRQKEEQMAANKRAEAEAASILQGIDDERLRLTMSAADYEQMILDRRIEQAGITDTNAIEKIKSAIAQREVTRQNTSFTEQLIALERQAAELTMSKVEAERAVYAEKVASLKLSAIQSERLMEEFDSLQALRAEKENSNKIDAMSADVTKRRLDAEQRILEATFGREYAERRAYEKSLESLGVSGKRLESLLAEYDAMQDMAKEAEEMMKAERERERLTQERARAIESLAQAEEAAREKAADMELRRQQMTEGVSTAIGEIKIAAVSDSVDVQKVIADETKKQTAELRKINTALVNAGGVLT